MIASGATWLCPDDQARARLLDNSPRVRRARTVASLGVGVAVLYAAPRYSWWLVPMFVLSLISTSTVDVRMRHARRPEYQAAFTIFLSQALMAVTDAVTGGALSPMLPLIVIPTAFVATRFRPRICFVASGIAIVMLLLVALIVDPRDAVRQPAELLASVVLLVGVGAATQALFAAELQHRRRAILDPLTGLLNRQGLRQRFAELAEQARLMEAPISLLICDLDHFKLVNDRHGHATGDAVLRDVAYCLRRELRSFELIYRLGGEEFLIVLPGAAAEDATELAERLCATVRDARPQKLELTISIGVSTHRGPELRFERLYEAADQALYQAKSGGRDQVVTAGETLTPQPAF